MPRPSSGLIEVVCPCCETTLRIDPETQSVISHKEKPRPKTLEDINSGISRLKQEAAERDEKFRRSVEEQKNRQQVLSKKFDELFKQAKENPDQGPRRKDIDLD
jgi:uncharacterized Zn finger protein (UPF0148 family)